MKIPLLKDQDATVLCSGPSVSEYSDDNTIAIVPNRSILLPHLVNFKKVIWLNGTGWKRPKVYSWWKELALKVKIEPDYIIARKDNPNDHLSKEFGIFRKDFLNFFPQSSITGIWEAPDREMVSTGMSCIKLALDNSVKSINISGMEMGADTKYSSELMEMEVISKMGDDSFTRHLKADIKYLQSLNKNDIKKINPCKSSGLKKFLQSNEK